MTDQELIDQFLHGDLHAFNTLVWRWQKPIYNFILRYIGDAEEAKDLCQKTFLQAYRHLKRLRDPARFKSWLYQISANLCRDEIKRRHRNHVYSLEAMQESGDAKSAPPLEVQQDDPDHPERHLRRVELEGMLQRALQLIPEEQRVVVIMKEYQGLKFTEIAQALDAPLNTVKSRMYYGLSALRKVLEKWHIDQEAIAYDL